MPLLSLTHTYTHTHTHTHTRARAQPPPAAPHTQSTQPLIEENGVLRWALGNVAHSDTPPCRSMLSDVQADARWAAAHALTRSAAQDGAGSSPYWSQFGGPPRTWRTNGDGYKARVVGLCAWLGVGTPRARMAVPGPCCCLRRPLNQPLI
jgi:hypothetical protein